MDDQCPLAGSEAQRERWLPALATGESLGTVALAEATPDDERKAGAALEDEAPRRRRRPRATVRVGGADAAPEKEWKSRAAPKGRAPRQQRRPR